MMMMMFHRHTAWVTQRSWWRYSTQRALSTPPPTSNNQTDKMMMIMMFYRHTLWDTRTSWQGYLTQRVPSAPPPTFNDQSDDKIVMTMLIQRWSHGYVDTIMTEALHTEYSAIWTFSILQQPRWWWWWCFTDVQRGPHGQADRSDPHRGRHLHLLQWCNSEGSGTQPEPWTHHNTAETQHWGGWGRLCSCGVAGVGYIAVVQVM